MMIINLITSVDSIIGLILGGLLGIPVGIFLLWIVSVIRNRINSG